MAVAMVFTVVKVNDSKKVAKAGEGTTEGVTDSSFLADGTNGKLIGGINYYIDASEGKAKLREVFHDYYNYDKTDHDCIVYIQNDKVSFELPQPPFTSYGWNDGQPSGMYIDSYTIKMDGVNLVKEPVKYSDPNNTFVDNPTDRPYITISYNYKFENFDNTLLNSSMVDGKTYTASRQRYGDYTWGNEDSDGQGGKAALENALNGTNYLADEVTGVEVFTVKCETKAPSSTDNYTINASTGEITDKWGVGAGANEFYYGHNEFIISGVELTADQLASETSYQASVINAALTTYYPNDGTYYVYQRYVTDVSDGNGGYVYYTDTTNPKTVNINRELDTRVTANDGHVGEGETEPVLFMATTPADDIAGIIDDADKTKNIVLTIATDEEATTKLEKIGGTESDPTYTDVDSATLVVNEAGKYIGTNTIPADEGILDGDIVKYRLTITNGAAAPNTLTHVATITVKYSYNTISIDNVAINNTNVVPNNEATPLLTNHATENTLVVTADIGDGLTEQSVEVYSAATEGTLLATLTQNETDKSKWTGTYTFGTEEKKAFYIIAEGTKGTGEEASVVSVTSDPYYLQYDATKPVVNNVTIKQGEKTLVPTLSTDEAESASQILQLDADSAFSVEFDVLDSVGVDNTTVSLRIGETTFDSSATGFSSTDITSGKHYKFENIQLADPDLTKAKTYATLAYTISAADTAGNVAVDEEGALTGEIPFVDEVKPIVRDVVVKQDGETKTKYEADDPLAVEFNVYEEDIQSVVLAIGTDTTTVVSLSDGTPLVDQTYGKGASYTATITLGSDDKIAAKRNGKLTYTITARDKENAAEEVADQVTNDIPFVDEVNPVVDNVLITQEIGGVKKTLVSTLSDDEAERANQILAVDSDTKFTVEFDIFEVNLDSYTLKVGDTEATSFTPVGTINNDTYGSGKHYSTEITLSSEDIVKAKQNCKLNCVITAKDKDNNEAEAIATELTKEIPFIDEASPIISDVYVSQTIGEEESKTEITSGGNSHKLYAGTTESGYKSFDIGFKAEDPNLTKVTVDIVYTKTNGTEITKSFNYTVNENNTAGYITKAEDGSYVLHINFKENDYLSNFHAWAVNGNSARFTITAKDNINADSTFAGVLLFHDEKIPVISEVDILQDQNNDNALESIAIDTKKLTSKKSVRVYFRLNDDPPADNYMTGSGINEDDISVTLVGGSDGTLIDKTYTTSSTPAVKPDIGDPDSTDDDKPGYYYIDIPANDLTPAVGGGEYDLTINVKDNDENSAATVSKTLTFYNENAEISFVPSTSGTKDNVVIDSNTYANYNNIDGSGIKLFFTITVKSEVPLDTASIVGVDSENNSIGTITCDTTTTESGKYVYTFTTPEVDIATGSITLDHVSVTNVFGQTSTSTEAASVFYADITNPTGDVTGYNSSFTTNDNKITDYDSWYKNVYLIFSSVTDANVGLPADIDLVNDGANGNPAYSGMVVPDSATFPTTVNNGGQPYSFLFKVNNSTELEGTAISFSIKDKLGNTYTNDNKKIKVDGIKPAIADGTFKVGTEDVTADKTTFTVTSDVSVSAAITDNMHVNDVIIKCISAPSNYDSIIKSETYTGYVVNNPVGGSGRVTREYFTRELSKIVSGDDAGVELVEGTYVLTLDAYDIANNELGTQTITIIIDGTAPIADINAKVLTDPKSTGTHGDEVKASYVTDDAARNYDYYKYARVNKTLTFTVVDDNVVADNIVVKDNDVIIPTANLGWSYDATTKTWTGSYEFLAGKHSVTIAATDNAGTAANVRATQKVEFTIDKAAPTTNISLNESVQEKNSEATHYIYNTTVRVNMPALDDEDKNLDQKDVYLCGTFKSATGSETETFPKQITFSGVKPNNLTFEKDGEYCVWVEATDYAGNKLTSDKVYFMIDKVNPDIDVKVDTAATKNKFTSEYKHTGTHYNTTYTYSQFFNKDVELTLKVFDYNKDTITVKDNGEKIAADFTGSNGEYTAKIKVSEEGKHKIVVEATDTATGQGTSTPVEFTIDKTNPTLDLTLNGETDPEDMLRVDGDVSIGYKLTDTNKDSTDVKITYVFTPAGGSKKDPVPEELYDDAKKTFKENGTYEVKITAIDKAGNSSSDSASFVIDNQKPEIDLKITTSKPAKIDKFKRTYKPAVEGYFTTDKDGYEYGQYYKENVKVKISVFDYDVKDFTVYDNDEKVTPEFKDQGNGLYTAEITVSEEGSHIIKAESVDKSGNTGKSSELSFIIDKTAPALTTTLDGEKYSATDRYCASDAVVGLKIEDKNHDADDVLRYYEIVPSDHSATKTDKSYVTALQETYKQNAYYTVTYTVVDRAGNSSTAKIGFTIDNTKPQSDIRITTKAPAKIDKYHNEYSNTNGHFNTAYTYGQYYNESVAMDMAVFDYNVSKIVVTDNDEVIPVTFSGSGDERTASSVTVSDEGEHVVKIIVTDMSGNEAVSKSVSFIIDKSAPGLSATLNNSSSITEQFLQTDASVYLSVSDTNEDEDDVTRIVKMTRPSASAETSEETGALEGAVSYTTEADYEITYTAIDRAGNKSDPITLTFRVDKTAPQLSFSGITRDATAAEDTTITYNMLEDFYWDMTSATVKIYQKVDGMGETPIRTVEITASGASTALSETFKEDGQYRFEFTAQDKAGNQATESFTFILDENAPVIILSGVDGYLTDEDVSFGVQVDETFYLGNNVKLEGTVKTLDDPKGKAIVFDDYSRLTRTASANFEQLFTEDGIYNIKVTSKDVAGNETVQTVQFTIDKTKPLIKDLEELADEEDYKAYTDAVAANDKDAKKLIPIFSNFEFDYEADDIVTDLTTVSYKMYMDGVLYDGLSEIEDGFHTLKITAEDEVGNTAERSFYFILDTVKPGIIVTGVEEDDNLQEPTTITVSLQLTEDSLKSVKLNGEAIAIVNNTATLEVRDKGDYELVIEAVDDAGNESTMTIKFEYGKTSSWLWLLIAGGAALLIAAATFFIILGKKRKKKE